MSTHLDLDNPTPEQRLAVELYERTKRELDAVKRERVSLLNEVETWKSRARAAIRASRELPLEKQLEAMAAARDEACTMIQALLCIATPNGSAPDEDPIWIRSEELRKVGNE